MFKLSDDVIGHLAQLLQMAILTGTDITDNLRLVELVESAQGTLSLTEGYVTRFNDQVESMLAHAQAIQEAQAKGRMAKDVGQS